MAIASDIYSIHSGETCPGCSKKDTKRAPEAFQTKDYTEGDPRREATAAVRKFAKNKKAFFKEFAKTWDKVTTNGHLKDHLKPLSAFPTCKSTKSAASTAATCPHTFNVKCDNRHPCAVSRLSKCVNGMCMCHKSECAVNNACRQNPTWQGPRGGLSLSRSSFSTSSFFFSEDGELEGPAMHDSGNVGIIVGSALGGAAVALLAVAGVAVVLRKRESSTAQGAIANL